jgi:hypothetical protein
VKFLITLITAFMLIRMTEQIDQFFNPDGALALKG